MSFRKILNLIVLLGFGSFSLVSSAEEYYCSYTDSGQGWENLLVCLILYKSSDTYQIRVTNKEKSGKSSAYIRTHINNTSTGFHTGNMPVDSLAPGKSWYSAKFGGKNGSYYQGVLENKYGMNMAVTPKGKL